jgi:hypothetical protein
VATHNERSEGHQEAINAFKEYMGQIKAIRFSPVTHKKTIRKDGKAGNRLKSKNCGKREENGNFYQSTCIKHKLSPKRESKGQK